MLTDDERLRMVGYLYLTHEDDLDHEYIFVIYEDGRVLPIEDESRVHLFAAMLAGNRLKRIRFEKS